MSATAWVVFVVLMTVLSVATFVAAVYSPRIETAIRRAEGVEHDR
jgi:hypothetical protein